jgi:hypothetical protein
MARNRPNDGRTVSVTLRYVDDHMELSLGMIDVEIYALDFTIYGRDLTSGKADFTLDGDLSALHKENISKDDAHLSGVELVLKFGNEYISNGELRVDLGRPRDRRG